MSDERVSDECCSSVVCIVGEWYVMNGRVVSVVGE